MEAHLKDIVQKIPANQCQGRGIQRNQRRIGKSPKHTHAKVRSASIPASELIEKSITGSADTDFSSFLNALKATAWVSQGHAAYQHQAGKKCPYCQQELPETFEADLASCFNEQYKKDVEALQKYREAYKNALNAAHSVMSGNMGNGFECEQLVL